MPGSTYVLQNKTAKSNYETNSRVKKVIELKFDKNKADLTQNRGQTRGKKGNRNKIRRRKTRIH